jgi:hypothetical protein
VASAFHRAYEDLAPALGYRTRLDSARPWAEVPQTNRDLMVATVRALFFEPLGRHFLCLLAPTPTAPAETTDTPSKEPAP